MTDSETSPGTPDLRDKLNAETARLRWEELERHFAAGRLIQVAAGLDLVAVAAAFGADDSDRVQAWLQSAQVAPLGDAQALEWAEQNAMLWAVVVRPWVLVQDSQAEPGD